MQFDAFAMRPTKVPIAMVKPIYKGDTEEVDHYEVTYPDPPQKMSAEQIQREFRPPTGESKWNCKHLGLTFEKKPRKGAAQKPASGDDEK